MAITKQTQINDVISKYPKSIEGFFSAGMMCIGCPMSRGETIEQGCQAHGMSNKEIDKFIEDLNKKYSKESPKKKIKKQIKKPMKKLIKKSIKKVKGK